VAEGSQRAVLTARMFVAGGGGSSTLCNCEDCAGWAGAEPPAQGTSHAAE
jgi:hypothetical protein